jgi:hypothetical protein
LTKLRLFRFWSAPLLVLPALLLVVGWITAAEAATESLTTDPPGAQDRAIPRFNIDATLSISTDVELLNPSFEEGPSEGGLSDVYNADGVFESRESFENIALPEGWTVFFKQGLPSGGIPWDGDNEDGWGRPATQLIEKVAPYLDPLRVHSEDWAFKLFTDYWIHDAGLYQQVAVSPGTRWRLRAWVHAWSSCESDPHISILSRIASFGARRTTFMTSIPKPNRSRPQPRA